MFRQLGRFPDSIEIAFHTRAVITIRQKATSSAGVSARFTNVDANENTVIVMATAIAPSVLLPGRPRPEII
jgi:hypothetical protein